MNIIFRTALLSCRRQTKMKIKTRPRAKASQWLPRVAKINTHTHTHACFSIPTCLPAHRQKCLSAKEMEFDDESTLEAGTHTYSISWISLTWQYDRKMCCFFFPPPLRVASGISGCAPVSDGRIEEPVEEEFLQEILDVSRRVMDISRGKRVGETVAWMQGLDGDWFGREILEVDGIGQMFTGLRGGGNKEGWEVGD